VRLEKASVVIERNETIALGMEWSSLRLLIAMAELCYNCKPCKVALWDGKQPKLRNGILLGYCEGK